MLVIVFQNHRDLAYRDCVYLLLAISPYWEHAPLAVEEDSWRGLFFCLDVQYSHVATLCD